MYSLSEQRTLAGPMNIHGRFWTVSRFSIVTYQRVDVLRLTDTSHLNSPGMYEYIRVARVGLSVHIGLVFRYVKLCNSHKILSKCLTQWTFHISELCFLLIRLCQTKYAILLSCHPA